MATITGAQWRMLLDRPGPNHWDVVFSPDGIQWSIVDSGTAPPRILAIGATEIVVQRQAWGIFSQAIAVVDAIPIPSGS